MATFSHGDTIDVLGSLKTTHRIRLAGIDAPEKAQPFGQRSKEHLSDSVFGKQVEVQGGKIDKYGRTVGRNPHVTTTQVRAIKKLVSSA